MRADAQAWRALQLRWPNSARTIHAGNRNPGGNLGELSLAAFPRGAVRSLSLHCNLFATLDGQQARREQRREQRCEQRREQTEACAEL